MTAITVPLAPAIKQVKVELRASLPKFMSLRFRIAAFIVKIAAWIAGTGVEIGVTSPSPPTRLAHYDREGLPIRMAVSDRDFDPEIGRSLNIWVDGVLQDKVIAFDRDEGFVERYQLRDGQMFAEGDEVAKETVTGEVVVSWRE